MSVAGVCPECGSARPVAEFLEDARAREALAAALQLDPRLADPLLDYLALFAPPGRKIQTRKLVRLLTELQQMIGGAEVSIDRVTYAAPVEYWRTGMETTAAARATLTLPLDSHGYLRKVVFGIASKAAGRAEQRAEDAQRYRYARPSSGGPVQAGALTPALSRGTGEGEKRSKPPPGWKDNAFKPPGGNDA